MPFEFGGAVSTAICLTHSHSDVNETKNINEIIALA